MANKPASPTGFTNLLADVKQRIQSAQTRSMLAVNSELVRLYWDIGRIIDRRQKAEGWGAAVIPKLALELKNEMPELKGFSERNIKRMLAFHREYPDPATILQQPEPESPPTAKVPQPVAQLPDTFLWAIPWAHHIVLMEKVKDLPARRWYMQQTLANGWSRHILTMQIETQAHARHGKARSNFALTLPQHQSDLVQQTLKDPYIFDFLTLTEPFQERELETALVRHLEKFLLELGQGFAFVGRQHKIEVGDEDFYIDLLFYHLHLRAFVVIELKKGKFKPEYAGKLNFYCNVVNDRLKQPTDQPTIGLILCQERSRLLAEYSFAGIDKPIGISTYELTRALPQNLRSALPTVEEIEAELAPMTARQKTDPPRKQRGDGQCREGHIGYGSGSVRIMDQPFDVADGADTPFGRRWGGDVVTLTPEHLAAIKAGKTLALDVRDEYVLFAQAENTPHKRPARRKGERDER
jgi:predicted nuclease of restriction endonuclease-like (RecB) superfamily